MCVFSAPKVEAMGTPPPVAPRQDTDTALPVARDTAPKDQKADLKYGNTKKDRGSAAANKTGTDALKINLDENKGSGTGGLNV
tara:strand:- start:369 stop:617 length:249 start_codon:yes stop_codon:yes gene_type:complete